MDASRRGFRPVEVWLGCVVDETAIRAKASAVSCLGSCEDVLTLLCSSPAPLRYYPGRRPVLRCSRPQFSRKRRQLLVILPFLSKSNGVGGRT